MRAAPPTQDAMTTMAMMVFLDSFEDSWAAAVVEASLVVLEDAEGAETREVEVTMLWEAWLLAVWEGGTVSVMVGGAAEVVAEEEDVVEVFNTNVYKHSIQSARLGE